MSLFVTSHGRRVSATYLSHHPRQRSPRDLNGRARSSLESRQNSNVHRRTSTRRHRSADTGAFSQANRQRRSHRGLPLARGTTQPPSPHVTDSRSESGDIQTGCGRARDACLPAFLPKQMKRQRDGAPRHGPRLSPTRGQAEGEA